MSLMTIKDLEQVQKNLSEGGLDYQLELVEGKIEIMGHRILYRVKLA